MSGEPRSFFPRPDDPAYWPTVSAIADGRLPDDVEPDTAQGRYLLAMIEDVRADVARAPELSPTQLAPLVILLRGGQKRAA